MVFSMKERNSVVVEEYLQVIYNLQTQQNSVKAVHLAANMESSPSTVHATLSRLQRDKLVTVNKKKEIRLTKNGTVYAESLIKRHRLVEYFLCNTLGISWHEVHEHAHILEHGLTPLVEEKLSEFLGHPKACPHGVPMPGLNDTLPENLISLTEAIEGDEIQVIVIEEKIEEKMELMKFLQDKNITPGEKHLVSERMEITRTVVLTQDKISTTIPFDIAENIKVVKV